jgi:phage recombination protein Bet
MSQQLAKAEQANYLERWSPADMALIRATVAQRATDSEFKLFLYTAHKYGLDPLVKQIWCVKYQDSAPAAIFTGRDGFLEIAHRSGQFDGMETKAVRGGDKGQLIAATCQVWRRDMTHPFVVEVSLAEYNSGKGNWSKMPETMLKKVAESQCLRRAFNISGLYEPGEMDSAVVEAETQRPPAPPHYTKAELDELETQLTHELEFVAEFEALEQIGLRIKALRLPDGAMAARLRLAYQKALRELGGLPHVKDNPDREVLVVKQAS